MPSKTPHAYALYAFHVLESHLNNIKPQYSISSFSQGDMTISTNSAPLFVTWNVLKHGEKQLRGCIGTFSPLPLERGIAEYAAIAAFEDTRFRPISKREVSSLSVSVTVLMDFEDAKDALDWELGKHGVRVKLSKGGRSYGATFLPEVATEQGWDKEETIDHCIRKGGYRGLYDLSDVKVIRYEGVKFGCTFDEYKDVIDTME